MNNNLSVVLVLQLSATIAFADLNVDIYRSSTAYHIAKTVNVPADATLDVISKSIYLEEGDTLRLTASANTRLEAVCSYEIIA